MSQKLYLQRHRFQGRDVDSFVIPCSVIPDVEPFEIRLSNGGADETRTNVPSPRIGIILAMEKGYEGYVIDEPYVEALSSVGAELYFLTYDSISAQMAALKLDGLFLPGGSFDSPCEYYIRPELLPSGHQLSQRSLAYLEAIDYALAQKIPMLGVCAGFQMLVGKLGGKMLVNVEKELNSPLTHKADKRTKVHSVAVVPGSRLQQISASETIMVNSVHSEGVAEPDADVSFLVSARATDGNVEAIETKGEPFVVGVQWHPEYLYHSDPAATELFKAFINAAGKYQGKNNHAN